MISLYMTNFENFDEVIETPSLLLSEAQALELLNLGRTTFREFPRAFCQNAQLPN
jgi:hypothetical protein